MARKKTPNRPSKGTLADGTDTAADGVAEGKVVSVDDAGSAPRSVSDDTLPAVEATDAASDPEMVEAEVVTGSETSGTLDDEAARADGVETRPADVGDDGVIRADEPVAAETTDRPRKKGGFPWGAIAALVLAGVIGFVIYTFLQDGGLRIGDDDRVAEEAAPGVVVSDAAPFPGNELDAPIRGEAAPGTRAAAREADAARLASEDEPSASRTEPAADEVGADAGTVSALRARAAERSQARRDARAAAAADAAAVGEGETSPFYVADATDAAADEPQADASTGDSAANEDVSGGMAARVAAARAAQARIREQDQARRADRTQQADETEDTGQADTDEAVDDPNALPQFTEDETPTTEVFGRTSETVETGQTDQADEEESRVEALRRARRTTRPTGRVLPLGENAAASGEGPGDGDLADDTSEDRGTIRPRGATVDIAEGRTTDDETGTDARRRTGTVADEEEFGDRLSEVREGLREDVLAETEARIRTAIEETEREVEDLREALTEQEARSDQRIAQLTDRLEVLQRRDASASQQGVLILALSNLEGAVDRGEPFERQLDDVERIAPGARSLRTMRRYAADGLPTDRTLSDRFEDAARRALAAEGRSEADGPFAGFMANLRGLFTVRRVGEVEGDTPSAIISRAEAALARDDLTGAVRELDALDGGAADAFTPWMEDARAKVEVADRIDRLERAVLAQDR